MYSLQYGEKSPALEVEAGSDVADDLGVRVSCSHESDLPLKVCRLLLGRDATVAATVEGARAVCWDCDKVFVGW